MRKFKLTLVITVLMELLLLTSSMAHAGLILSTDTDTGKLLGAQNIELDGRFYNVEFVDGTCIEVFRGCDSKSDFFWQSDILAYNASLFLRNHVIRDGAQGNFSTKPNLVNGCTHNALCQISTPYGIEKRDYVKVAWVNNYNNKDNVGYSTAWPGWKNDQDFSQDSLRVWAVWSAGISPMISSFSISNPNPTTIPEPSSYLLFLLALIPLANRVKK